MDNMIKYIAFFVLALLGTTIYFYDNGQLGHVGDRLSVRWDEEMATHWSE